MEMKLISHSIIFISSLVSLCLLPLPKKPLPLPLPLWLSLPPPSPSHPLAYLADDRPIPLTVLLLPPIPLVRQLPPYSVDPIPICWIYTTIHDPTIIRFLSH